jgi:hypothetical protein
MRKSRILAVVLAFVGLSVVMASGLTAVWLTEEIRVLSLVILPSTVVATLLVLYFEWRGKLFCQVGVRPPYVSQGAMDEAIAESFPASEPREWKSRIGATDSCAHRAQSGARRPYVSASR